MNAVEIEEALSELAAAPFDPQEFPWGFLAALGRKETDLKRLRAGDTNKSDLKGGVLPHKGVHIAVCAPGEVHATLQALKASPATTKAKAPFVLATDGILLEAEDLKSGETIACDYPRFADHFGFFLALAGISTVKEIKENPVDIKATGRLNRLYTELLKDNPDWGTEARRPDMNHFMARLIFCFFAEDTGIFSPTGVFTRTVEQMGDATNTHDVLETIFKAMNVTTADREKVGLPGWANRFPYVNGGLFAGATAVPKFTRVTRGYLMHAGGLDWKQINPDIFGSMIQAVADDQERGALGMHYTSVPNILKVLNPLFLDDLRAQLQAAGDNKIKLLNLRKRLTRIRVFDPACGSGNFLVIAYKQLRAIEAEINRRRGEDIKSQIPLTNFRGIEIRDFAAEIARLALVIAEFQCDVLYRGQQAAVAEFLPLSNENWIVCGNALRLDWLRVVPPVGAAVKLVADDLFRTPLNQSEINFENEGGETFICGNPPYLGSTWQTASQKADLAGVFDQRVQNWKSLDYVSAWFMKAADYTIGNQATAAFVATNSICQGQQVPVLWPAISKTGNQIAFAHTSFRWANLASHKAGVTVVIVAISKNPPVPRRLFLGGKEGADGSVVLTSNINAYLVPFADVIVSKASATRGPQQPMVFGNKPVDGGHLLLSRSDLDTLGLAPALENKIVRTILGSAELIRGLPRWCLWISDDDLEAALAVDGVRRRVDGVRTARLASPKAATAALASTPHRFGEIRQTGTEIVIIVPSVSSESRPYLPVGCQPAGTIVSNLAFAMFDAPLWNMALVASRLHLVWIATVCGKLKTDFRYSNTLGWNTFPVPELTEQNRADLTDCAEGILLAREAHFPKTIADLYDPEDMPENLRMAHERNDEVLERIYIGRRFKNDTERLEKLFDMYAKGTSGGASSPPPRRARAATSA